MNHKRKPSVGILPLAGCRKGSGCDRRFERARLQARRYLPAAMRLQPLRFAAGHQQEFLRNRLERNGALVLNNPAGLVGMTILPLAGCRKGSGCDRRFEWASLQARRTLPAINAASAAEVRCRAPARVSPQPPGAKWRSSPRACNSVLKHFLIPPTLS